MRSSAARAASSRSKGELTAERILDVAERLFAERGYAGTTLRDVAAEVGIRNPSLYNHFSSKDSLYAAVLSRGLNPVLEMLSEFVIEGRGAGEESKELIELVMELLAQHPSLPRLIQYETLSGGDRLTPILRDSIRPIFARAQQVIEAGPGAARWQPSQIPMLVLALYHVVVGYFTVAPLYKELNGTDLLSKPELARQAQFLSDLTATLLPSEPSTVTDATAERGRAKPTPT